MLNVQYYQQTLDGFEKKDFDKDEVLTPSYVIERFMKHVELPYGKLIHCFDRSDSEFVQYSIKHGFDYCNTHIEGGYDFYTLPLEHFFNGFILSNPPYTEFDRMFERLLTLLDNGCKGFALLVPLYVFDTCKRLEVLSLIDKKYGIQVVYIGKRINFKGHTQPFSKPCIWLCCGLLHHTYFVE